MPRLRIKEALAEANRVRPEGTPRKTITSLAAYVYRDRNTKVLSMKPMMSVYVQNKFKFITLDMLKDICDYTGVSIDFLIDIN